MLNHASEVEINKTSLTPIDLQGRKNFRFYSITLIFLNFFVCLGNVNTTSTCLEVRGKVLAVGIPILLCDYMDQIQFLIYNENFYALSYFANHFADKGS